MQTTSTHQGAHLYRDEKIWTNEVLSFDAHDLAMSGSWTDFVTKGDSIPNWKWRLANCVDATTPLSGMKQTLSYRPGFSLVDILNVASGDHFEHQLSGVLHIPTTFVDDPALLSQIKAKNDAIVKFNNRTNSVTRHFQGGVVLGELAKTLHSIKNPAEALRRSVDTYRSVAKKLRREALRVNTISELRSLSRSLRRRRTAEATKALSGLWLETAYHWKPTLHDIDDGMQALAEEYATKMPFQSVRATGRDKSRTVVSSFHQNGNHSWVAKLVRETEVTFTLRGAIRAQAANPVGPDQRNWGFDLNSFAPTIWELTPYSFLIDYFTNIGDVIEGWSSGSHNLAWCNFSLRKSSTATDTAEGANYSLSSPGVIGNRTFSPCRVVSSWVAVDRSNYVGNFIPTFEWQIPGLSTKWLNIAALIASRSADRLH